MEFYIVDNSNKDLIEFGVKKKKISQKTICHGRGFEGKLKHEIS